MPEHKKAPPRPRPFWSGTITFGLINLPVSLFAANRSSRVRLRMVDDDGMPLSRRYFCPNHEQALTADEIVRGFEVEDEQRAGIATFVMRGKEHLVAIMAEKSILRAETLHFHDELRSPDDIGLPAKQQGDKKRVQHFKKRMNSHTRETLKQDHLSDQDSEAIRKRIDKKLNAGEDVVAAPDSAEFDDTPASDSAADLMQILKDSLEVNDEPAANQNTKGNGQSKRRAKNKSSRGKQGDGTPDDRTTLGNLSKKELYELAQKRAVAGRSNMTKRQLVKAIGD